MSEPRRDRDVGRRGLARLWRADGGRNASPSLANPAGVPIQWARMPGKQRELRRVLIVINSRKDHVAVVVDARVADALAYGIERFKPAAVVDVATLTGAVIVGLGHHRTGLLANNDALADQLLAAGEQSGEPLWRLPLGPEYTRLLKSEVADLKNVGDRTAGTITAAAFLQEFVGETPWAHLDIAGTAWGVEKSYINGKGPTGTAVRTLLQLIREWQSLDR